MHRIVASCFKAIAYAILFVILWDVGFYLWRANILNQRMESLMVSMQQVVTNNNYLPEGDYEMYTALLQQIAADMNTGDRFINGFYINYDRNSSYRPEIIASKWDGGNYVNANICRYRLDTPADYGDVAVIEIGVNINTVTWTDDGRHNAVDINPDHTGNTTFMYTYQVPCLNYATVTD